MRASETRMPPHGELAEYLRDISRLFIAASQSATAVGAKRYSAERAFELAQQAEQLRRRGAAPQAAGPTPLPARGIAIPAASAPAVGVSQTQALADSA